MLRTGKASTSADTLSGFPDQGNPICIRKRRCRHSREPALLSSIYDPQVEDRSLVRLTEIPQSLIDALLVLEDQSFYDHPGVDLKGIVRAFWINFRESRVVQGGSTVTQQLVRNLFLNREQTFTRKIQEALLACLLELTKTKEEILELYFNECYLGQDGSINICGIRQGARYYFNTEPKHLSVSQSALLVAILKGPNYYNPYRFPQRVLERRNLILHNLHKKGMIDAATCKQALAEPIPEKPYPIRNVYPAAADMIQRLKPAFIDSQQLQEEGFSIYTTLDTHLQRAAESALLEGLQELTQKHSAIRQSDEPLNGSIICIDPRDGSIRALVGGRLTRTEPFNRVLLAKRPVGSVIKPFLYLYALQQTEDGLARWFPNSILEDSPVTIQLESGTWSPQNYTNRYKGAVTLRYALEHSLNMPAVRLSQEIGIDDFARFMKYMELENVPAVPSLALGTLELSSFEVAKIFTLFANQGQMITPHVIQSIWNPQQQVVYHHPATRTTIAHPEATFQVLSMLEGVFQRGTAASAHQQGWKGIAAGKTGTTNDYHDAWFVGMTPELLTVVWVGYDHPKRTGLTGGQGALPIWCDFMQRVYPEGNVRSFLRPERIQAQLSIITLAGKPL